MNTFASLIELEEFERVRFYTVKIEPRDETEFGLFLQKFQHNGEYKESFENLLDWIHQIGENRGAKEYLFRPEEAAHALPPKAKYQFSEISMDKQLRLYCLRLCDEVVILFNGDVKTAKRNQDCSNVKPHFRFANTITRAIDKLLVEGDWEILPSEKRIETNGIDEVEL